jgi:predicted nucleotide-binding protein
VNVIRELLEKAKTSPDLLAGGGGEPAAQPQAAPTGATRVLKPPPKPAAAPTPAPASAPAPAKPAAGGMKKVYVIGEEDDPLRQELSVFLGEIGLQEITLNRKHGQMLPLDSLKDQEEATAAFFVFNSDDLAYAMFEVGHFVGKLGQGRVFVLHMSDVEFPKNVPGVVVRPIVVKLEEASLTIIKELKAAGYQISL